MIHSTTLSISVVSGKGGVGKSNLALNIGYALCLNNTRVLLVDCDMGLANMDVLLGISAEKDIQDILLHQASPKDILVPLRQHGQGSLDLIPANSGLTAFSELTETDIHALCSTLNPLAETYDFVILDLGAGISVNATSFAANTHLRVLVITPEPTSLTDGYAFIKVMHTRRGISDFCVLINQAEDTAEARQAFKRLNAVCEHFLKIKLHFLGIVHQDLNVHEAVRQQKPFTEMYPGSRASLDCIKIADLLTTQKDQFKKAIPYQTPLHAFTDFSQNRGIKGEERTSLDTKH